MKNGDMPAQALSGDANYDFTLKGAGYNPECQGLTKREMFAMAAMQGMLSSADAEMQNCGGKIIIENAIWYADALLLALEETK